MGRPAALSDVEGAPGHYRCHRRGADPGGGRPPVGVSQGWVSKLLARYLDEGEAAFEPRYAPIGTGWVVRVVWRVIYVHALSTRLTQAIPWALANSRAPLLKAGGGHHMSCCSMRPTGTSAIHSMQATARFARSAAVLRSGPGRAASTGPAIPWRCNSPK